MKKTVLILIGLILIGNLGFAVDTEFLLACLGQWGVARDEILEKQIKPINKAFGLNVDLSELERKDTAYSWAQNLFATKISTSIPSTGVKYEIIRNGKTVNSQSTTIQQGDTIRLRPEADIGSDWIVEGGTLDTPPITLLEPEVFDSLFRELWEKFNEKYPTSKWITASMYSREEPAPLFSTETTEFNETCNYYIADNGYPAYLVPIKGGKKAGVQIFNLSSIGSIFSNCEKVNNAVECKVTQSGKMPFVFSNHSFVHVDKIITGNKAVDAGWVAMFGTKAAESIRRHWNERNPVHELYPYTIPLHIQVIPVGEQAPVAVIECNEYTCDSYASYDPDGKITNYEWSTNNPYINCLGVPSGVWTLPTCTIQSLGIVREIGIKNVHITITLRVIDNSGHMGETVKNLKLSEGLRILEEEFELSEKP